MTFILRIIFQFKFLDWKLWKRIKNSVNHVFVVNVCDWLSTNHTYIAFDDAIMRNFHLQITRKVLWKMFSENFWNFMQKLYVLDDNFIAKISIGWKILLDFVKKKLRRHLCKIGRDLEKIICLFLILNITEDFFICSNFIQIYGFNRIKEVYREAFSNKI